MDPTAILVPALFILMALAATLSAAEVSLLRTPRVRLDLAASEGDPRASRLLAIDDDLTLGLNAILLVCLFAQVSAAAIGGYLAQRWFGGYGPSIAAVALTMVLFIYGEALPKTLAIRRPLSVALRLSRFTQIVVKAARRPTKVLLQLADLQIPGRGASARTIYSEEELRALMVQSARAGEIDTADAALAQRSFDFGDTTVADILVPRDRIVAVPSTASLELAIEAAITAGHRRLPVYEGSLDSIVGVVRVRDLAAELGAPDRRQLAALAQPVLHVAPAHHVGDLLTELQETGLRFAVVRGGDGETVGIATMEDIVAELVGEIEDPR